ncbi:MAG: hypothetical protein FJ265_22080, partial [Planctomycetes bacterium]|nr:hypothetical protein [Planctomycetota bacterium]
MPSPSRKPSARSSSRPGVRIVSSCWPCTASSRGSSRTSRSSRPSARRRRAEPSGASGMLEVGRLRAADDMVEAARASVKVMVQGLMLASQRQWDTLARMRFLRLQLKNWKNFRAVDVSLRPRTFLVGPNAAGKSNLLDALRFLRDVAQPKGGGLLAAVDDLRPGFRQVRSLHARQESNVVVEVDVGNDDADRWRYRLELGGERNEPRNEPKIVGEQVWRGEQCLLERPNEDDRGDPARLRQTHLEQVSTNRPFRDLADFFAGVSYLHLVPQLLREPRRFEVVGRDPLGSDFLRRLADAPERQRKARLRRIQQALRVAVPNLRQLETKSDPDGTPHLRGQFEHWRPGTGWQNERQFSDGTLRLVALLWILAEGSEPLLLEEPELSLH